MAESLVKGGALSATRHVTLDLRAFHPGQVAMLKSKARVVVVLAGTGGGKSKAGPAWCFRQCQRSWAKGQFVHGIVAAPYKVLRTTTQPAVISLFRKLQIGDWESKADGIFRLDPGGFIYFRSADTPESMEGAHCDWAWLDEIGQRQFPVEAFDTAQRRVRFRGGPVLGTSTPYTVGWLKELTDSAGKMLYLTADNLVDLQEVITEGRKDVEVIRFPSIANPLFTQEEFERARETLPAWQFRMFYLAEWDRPAGLIYGDYLDDVFIDALPEGHEAWPVYCGVDFGQTHPTVVIYGKLAPDKTLYVFDEYVQSDTADAENARNAKRDRIARSWGDPAAKGGILAFRRAGWNIHPCQKGEVRAGISVVQDMMGQGRLKIVRGSVPKLQKELDSYVWDILRPETPVKINDDACFPADTLVSTLNGDRPISEVSAGDWAWTRHGWRQVVAAAQTGVRPLYECEFSGGRTLSATANHPVWVVGKGFVRMDALRYGDVCLSLGDYTRPPAESGNGRLARFLRSITSTIKTMMTGTTRSTIWNAFPLKSTRHVTPAPVVSSGHTWNESAFSQQPGTGPEMAELGTNSTLARSRRILPPSPSLVTPAGRSLRHASSGEPETTFALDTAKPNSASSAESMTKRESAYNAAGRSQPTAIPESSTVPLSVLAVRPLRNASPVYNLTVDRDHEFFANGILVKNCDALRYLCIGLQRGGKVERPSGPIRLWDRKY